ncbi:MAG: hypothetical protein MJZ87_01680 [Bacteroidales bacterium]|nr:hypothetical protein [Bacteroidales bacterium]
MIHFTTYQQSSPRSANGGYRYFFNGQECDGEVYGEGGLTGYEFRQYDTRLGRWWGVDFQSEFLPGISPYSFSYNSPILFVDSKGKAGIITVTPKANGGGEIVIKSIIFVYGEGARAAAIEANNTWKEGVKQGFNSYTYYDENNKPWIVTVNVTFVVTESLSNNKTVDNNLKDISDLNCQVTGVDPQTGKKYSYNSPGYGGSMIASIVHNIQELQQYSGQSESDAMGWGDHGGGLIAIGAKQFIHEMFHGFGLRQHLTGNENEQDVLFKYGGGVHIRAIHFIDFCENILKLYNNGRFKDGIPSTYNSDFIETPSDMIEIKENEQIERKALYEQVSK